MLVRKDLGIEEPLTRAIGIVMIETIGRACIQKERLSKSDIIYLKG